MKFNHLQAFEKHLQTAQTDHLSKVYLIVDPEVFAQKKLARSVCQQDEEWQSYEAECLTALQLDEILNTSSMFAQKSCICLLGLEKLSKKLLKKLIDYSKHPDGHKRLVMTASSMSKDYLPLTKNGVALDLSLEKPWDREKRLSAGIMQTFRSYQLRASSSVCDQMVKLCGNQTAVIDQETEKMALYLHGKSEVSIQDLDFVLASPQISIFKVTQALFDGHYKEALTIVNKQKFPFILLVYSLRAALQRSFRLKSMPRSDYTQKMPHVKGYLLEKSLKLAAQYSSKQFKELLQMLFKMELLMKSQPLSEEVLISLLIFQMKGLS